MRADSVISVDFERVLTLTISICQNRGGGFLTHRPQGSAPPPCGSGEATQLYGDPFHEEAQNRHSSVSGVGILFPVCDHTNPIFLVSRLRKDKLRLLYCCLRTL